MTDPAIIFSPASRFNPALKRALNDILGGRAASVLTVTFGLSYSLLIFAGPLSPYLSYGITATFVSSAVLAVVIGLGSSLPFAIGAPDSSTAAVTGILAASVVERLETANLSAPLLSPVLITLGLSTVLTGLVLCGLGLTRLGRAIRYVPYPVVGGFLGATGLLIALGAVRVITNHPLQFTTLTHFANGTTLLELGAACAMALVLYLTWHRSRSPFGLPIILVGGVLTAHLAFWITGVSFDHARALGWTFQPPPQAVFMLPWHTDDLARYPWFAVPDLLGNVVAVIFVTASSTLFNTTGIEVAVHREANLERELNVTGAANILTGMLGGYAGCSSISRSILNFSSGGRGRLSGLTVAALSLLMLAVAPDLLGFIPKFVIGGLLLYLGADQLHKWIIESRKRLSKLEYLSLIAIIAIIVAWGFVPGHPDRRDHRLRDVCVQRRTGGVDQVQFRRLGISLLARPLARRPGRAAGPWRQHPGPQPAELSVLRLRQPALPARQAAAPGAPGVPLSAVRLQARHRRRLLGRLQLRPDQAQRA